MHARRVRRSSAAARRSWAIATAYADAGVVAAETEPGAGSARHLARSARGRRRACARGLRARAAEREVAVERRPVRHGALGAGIVHRRPNVADLAALDLEPLAERVARPRRSGLADEHGHAEHEALLVVHEQYAAAL